KQRSNRAGVTTLTKPTFPRDEAGEAVLWKPALPRSRSPIHGSRSRMKTGEQKLHPCIHWHTDDRV
ncbi:unnamed protein product, partial [Brassica rapa subsp. narinosa]